MASILRKPGSRVKSVQICPPQGAHAQSSIPMTVVRATASPHDPQQGVVANRQHQPAGKTRRRPSAECEATVMDIVVEPRRAPRPTLRLWEKWNRTMADTPQEAAVVPVSILIGKPD